MQAQVSSKDQTIEQLQGDVNLLMPVVYDLKAKLEKKFGSDFADRNDDLANVAHHEQKAEVRVVTNIEHEIILYAYLTAEPKKKRKQPAKKQSNKQMLVMKNQDMNSLNENFQFKDPTKQSDRYVMDLGSSHYDKVRKKSTVANWRYDHDKNMWLITRESGHSECYAKESQFESWTKIDLQSLLHAPYHDSDPNQRGRGWAVHAKLEREVKNNFQNMKVVDLYLKKSHAVHDTHTKRTVRTVIWPPTDKEKLIPVARKFAKGILKNIQFWSYDLRMAEAMIVTKENTSRLADTLDLMSFHEEDMKILGQNQIRTNEQHEGWAKSWTSAVEKVIGNRLFADVAPLYGKSAAGGPSS
ncbi:hypothetical protein Hdeb2414_s0005g00157641 [Helianthus debilis subsp. tardiflorus]